MLSRLEHENRFITSGLGVDRQPVVPVVVEPRREKTGLRGFRPGPTQTGLYSHTRWLEA